MTCSERRGWSFFRATGLVDHGLGGAARPPAILAPPPQQALESLLSVLLPFPPERRSGGLAPRPVGEVVFAFGQFAQKGTGLLGRNHSGEERTEQRTPENGPLLLAFLPAGHRTAPFRRPRG